ncbi:MAG: glycosyltransferase [Rhodospirillaceae bacterium]|nr:glycosyltransferase [Rhodospirillaceae bacterium]
MRILMAMAGLGGGGAESFFERLAIAFSARKHDVLAAIRPYELRREKLEASGVSVHWIRFGGLADLASRHRIRRLIRKARPDVTLSFMSRAASFIPAGGASPHIARLGGYYPLKHYRTADHLVVNTQDIGRWLIAQGAPPDTVSYVPNFTVPSVISPAIRSDYAVPDMATLVVALGRLHRNKGFDVLLNALAKQPDLYLWLAGDGPERKTLDRMTDGLGLRDRVCILGWVDDPAPLIAAADIVAVPSRYEPLGNVILEAWSMAKPIVAAASAGPVSLIENGVTGRLVPVDDSLRLGQALADVSRLPDRGASLGASGRERLNAEFSEETVLDQYLDLFERLKTQTSA